MRTKEYDMICILRKWLDDIKANEKELGKEGLKVQVFLGYEEVKLLLHVLENDYYIA